MNVSSQCACSTLLIFKISSVRRFLHNFYSLDTIGEEVRFVCLHDDNIEEVSPVFSNHVRHSFIPEKQIATQQLTLSHESEQTHNRQPRATDRWHLHKAEGAVGDEEEFLSLADQPMQNGIRLFSSENELICGEEESSVVQSGTVMLFYVEPCVGFLQKEEEDY